MASGWYDHPLLRTKSRTVFRLNWILVAALLVACVVAWPLVPAVIPIHFGITGNPDAWQVKEGGVWFLMPVTCAVMALVMTLLPKLAAAEPGSWNVGKKKLLVSLTPQQRTPIVSLLEESAAWLAIFVTTVFIVLQGEVFIVARAERSWLQWVFYATVGAAMIGALFRCHVAGVLAKRMLDALEASQGAVAPPPGQSTKKTTPTG